MTIKGRMKDGYMYIAHALDGCDISPRKRNGILKEYKSICYQWAEANAAACLLEGYFKDAAPEAYEEAIRDGIKGEFFSYASEMTPAPDEWDVGDGHREYIEEDDEE